MSLERLWAGWRSEYVGAASTNEEADGDCVLCRILASKEPRDQTYLLWREGFRDLNMGYASALGILLFIGIFAVSLVQRRFLDVRPDY